MWLELVAVVLALAALGLALSARRRVRRLAPRPQAPPVPQSPHAAKVGLDASVELSLEAMLEELESRAQEVMKKIERKERELESTFAFLREQLRPAAAPPGERATAPAGGRLGPATAATPPAHPDPPGGEAPPRSAGQKVQAVRRLAAEGLDVLAIAQRLGLGKGEVQLILELDKSQE